jgi:hypothetical protein
VVILTVFFVKECFDAGFNSVGPQIFAKGHLVIGRFVPPDILSRWTVGRQMFCSAGHFVRRTLGCRTFCRRKFCPSGRFVAGHFVWAPWYYKPTAGLLEHTYIQVSFIGNKDVKRVFVSAH